MVRNCILAAALAAGGLVAASPTAPAKADIAIGVNVGSGPAYAGYTPVYHRRWHHGPRVVYRPYRYRYGYRPYYRAPALGVYPAVGVYVAPAPRVYRRCWIDRRGYRVCGY